MRVRLPDLTGLLGTGWVNADARTLGELVIGVLVDDGADGSPNAWAADGWACTGTGCAPAVRSYVGDGATTLGPGVMFGAGGGNCHSMVGLACGAGVACCATRCALVSNAAAAESAELSCASPPNAAGPQDASSARLVPNASVARWNIDPFPLLTRPRTGARSATARPVEHPALVR